MSRNFRKSFMPRRLAPSAILRATLYTARLHWSAGAYRSDSGSPSDCSFGQDGEPASVLPRLEILEVAHADNVRALSNSHSTQSARARSFSRGLRLAAYGGHALSPFDLRLSN